jgi:hypothetical protein
LNVLIVRRALAETACFAAVNGRQKLSEELPAIVDVRWRSAQATGERIADQF